MKRIAARVDIGIRANHRGYVVGYVKRGVADRPRARGVCSGAGERCQIRICRSCREECQVQRVVVRWRNRSGEGGNVIGHVVGLAA